MDIYEYFAQKLGCCISDLRVEKTLPWSKSVILEIGQDAFSLDEWCCFASYVTSKECDFDTISGVRQFLIAEKISKLVE